MWTRLFVAKIPREVARAMSPAFMATRRKIARPLCLVLFLNFG